MKANNLLAVPLLCLLFLGTGLPKQGAQEITTVKWNQMNIDLGQIPQDVPVSIEYEVTNTGKLPLVITKAETGCNCTISSFPKEPIQPGKSGIIKARFNAADAGAFSKTINVLANTDPSRTILLFHGEVVPAE